MKNEIDLPWDICMCMKDSVSIRTDQARELWELKVKMENSGFNWLGQKPVNAMESFFKACELTEENARLKQEANEASEEFQELCRRFEIQRSAILQFRQALEVYGDITCWVNDMEHPPHFLGPSHHPCDEMRNGWKPWIIAKEALEK